MDYRARPTLAALLCCGSLAASGCTRTSDGSIEFQSPALFPWGAPVTRPSVTAFPSVPPMPAPIAGEKKHPAKTNPPVKKKSAPHSSKVAEIRPDPQPVEYPAAPISCGDAVDEGGRVKVLCQ